ncbi:MAG: SDR family NAD(P)-dependent oxidoreductase, partial [Sphingobacteriales bacterium]
MAFLKEMKTVSILGCGWFGFALAKELISIGYKVKGSTTSPEKISKLTGAGIDTYLVNFTSESISADYTFFDTGVLFICIPPKRNSAELESYPDKIRSILESAKADSTKIILISSTSVYGDENKIVNEKTETNPDTDSGKVVVAAEEIFKAQFPSD